MNLGAFIPLLIHTLIALIYNLYREAEEKTGSFLETFKAEHGYAWNDFWEYLLSRKPSDPIVVFGENIPTMKLRNLIRESPADIVLFTKHKNELTCIFFITIIALITVVISWSTGFFLGDFFNLGDAKIFLIAIFPTIVFIFEIYIVCRILSINRSLKGLTQKYKNKEY